MSRQARVGILVFAGLALFFLALFAVANRSFLFSNTFSLKSEFNNVAGLRSGAPVQFQGVRVGRVDAVMLPEQAGNPITVRMALTNDAQHLIHENTKAHIETNGLVGNKMVVLANPAGALAEQIDKGGTIPGVEPLDLTQMTDQAMAAVDTFATVAVEAQQIMQDVQRGKGTLGRFIYDPSLYNSVVATTRESERLMQALGRDAEDITQLAEEATGGVQDILAKVNTGDGTLARLLNDDEVYQRFLATTDTLQNVTTDLRAITSGAENTVNWAMLGAYRFSELMEAAKHNFIFKRYFEKRGYMEKADFEIRESALEATYQDMQALQRRLNERQKQLDAREARLNAQENKVTRSDTGSEDASTTSAGETSAGETSAGENPSASVSPAGLSTLLQRIREHRGPAASQASSPTASD